MSNSKPLNSSQPPCSASSPRSYLSSRTLLCETTEESTASNDPVISRIKRDVERKQEFLRATHLPNYLASPTSPTSPNQPPTASEQCQIQPPPVYFGDRFPVHSPRESEDPEGAAAAFGAAGQFYGLQLGKENFYENFTQIVARIYKVRHCKVNKVIWL